MMEVRRLFITAMSCALLCGPSSDVLATTIQFRLEVIDGQNELPKDSIEKGRLLGLNVWLTDLRDEPSGILSAYLDVTFDHTKVQFVSDSLAFGPQFGEIPSGAFVAPNELDEVGSFSSGTLAGQFPQTAGDGHEHLLLQAQFLAIATGDATFSGNPADTLPRHATTVFELNDRVPEGEMEFLSTSISIVVPEPDGVLFWPIAVATLFGFHQRQRRNVHHCP